MACAPVAQAVDTPNRNPPFLEVTPTLEAGMFGITLGIANGLTKPGPFSLNLSY